MPRLKDKPPSPRVQPSRSPLVLSPRAETSLAVALILLSGMVAYSNTFAAPFVFDARGMLIGSHLAEHFWSPLKLVVASNRPVATWTFAANYVIGGEQVAGYHVVNLVIHLAAGLTLFGVVRRTLRLGDEVARHGYVEGSTEGDSPQVGAAAYWIALVVALLWTVHPLQTQSVTYIYQRFESLMGLFFLLSLYCLIRARTGRQGGLFWYIASAVSCFMAIASKEVAAVAPLVLLWYDRVFLATSWRELIARRWAFYGPLFLMLSGAALYVAVNREAYANAGVLTVDEVSPWQYALTEPSVILHYLRLCFWPTGQCLDYAWPVATAAEAMPAALALLVVLAGVVWCIFRRPAVGFLGGCFLLILAPTSSVLPTVDLAFEHRMYLPLAAVVVAVVVGVYESLRWIERSWQISVAPLAVTLAVVSVVALSAATFARNEVYATEAAAWRDVATKAPLNVRAQRQYVAILVAEGQAQRALAHCRSICQRYRQRGEAHLILGEALLTVGLPREALAPLETAIERRPADADARLAAGIALEQLGDLEGAEAQFRVAVERCPYMRKAHLGLARVRTGLGKWDEAIEGYRRALELNDGNGEARNGIAITLAMKGNCAEAREAFGELAALFPNNLDYRENRAYALIECGDRAGAVEELEAVLRRQPKRFGAMLLLARAHAAQGDRKAARRWLDEARALAPGHPEVERMMTELNGQGK